MHSSNLADYLSGLCCYPLDTSIILINCLVSLFPLYWCIFIFRLSWRKPACLMFLMIFVVTCSFMPYLPAMCVCDFNDGICLFVYNAKLCRETDHCAEKLIDCSNCSSILTEFVACSLMAMSCQCSKAAAYPSPGY